MKLLTKFVFVVVFSLTNKVVHQLPINNESTIEATTVQNTKSTYTPALNEISTNDPATQATTIQNTNLTTPKAVPNVTSTTYLQLLTTLRKFFMTKFPEKYFSFFKWNWEALRDHSQKMERIHYQFKYREKLDYDELFKNHTTPFAIPDEYTKIYMGISEFDRRYSKHRFEHPEEYTDPTFPDITLFPFTDNTWPMLNENDTFLNSKGEQWDVV